MDIFWNSTLQNHENRARIATWHTFLCKKLAKIGSHIFHEFAADFYETKAYLGNFDMGGLIYGGSILFLRETDYEEKVLILHNIIIYQL